MLTNEIAKKFAGNISPLLAGKLNEKMPGKYFAAQNIPDKLAAKIYQEMRKELEQIWARARKPGSKSSKLRQAKCQCYNIAISFMGIN